MSLQSALSIARSGLYAQQLAVQIASHNIANAQTEGYTRQTLLTTATPPQVTPSGIVGTGVRTDVTRQRDALVDTAYRREAGRSASYGLRREVLQQIETVLGEPSETGLSANMDAFWSSWSDLSNQPTSAPAKAVVRQRALDLTSAINRTSNRFGEIAETVKFRMVEAVEELNGLAKKIAGLNGDIVASEAGVRTASDLRDMRDKLIDRAAQLGNVRVIENSNGAVQLVVDSETLVDGTHFRPVDTPVFTVSGGQVTATLSVRGAPVIFPSEGSAIGEMVRLINQEIYGPNGAVSRLDALAQGLVTQVNQMHRQGWSAAGEALGGGTWSGSPTGSMVDFFDPTRLTAAGIQLSTAVTDNYNTVAAGYVRDATSSNQLALDMAALRDNVTTMEGGTASFSGFYRDLVTGVALKISSADNSATVSESLAGQAQNRRQSTSGVSTDEELIRLIQHQQAYVAASKLLKVTDEMMQTLLNI